MTERFLPARPVRRVPPLAAVLAGLLGCGGAPPSASPDAGPRDAPALDAPGPESGEDAGELPAPSGPIVLDACLGPFGADEPSPYRCTRLSGTCVSGRRVTLDDRDEYDCDSD
jgi:hypothetical protein